MKDGRGRRCGLRGHRRRRPLLGGFLLHQHHPEDDVQDNQPKRHVKDAIVPGSRVHGSTQHGCYEDRYGHAHRHITHGLADRLRAYRVGQKRQTDGPDDGGGKALQEAADDEENESGAETEEESGTEEGEESDQEGQAPGGRVVGEITTYGCQKFSLRSVDGGMDCRGRAHIREAPRRDAP